MPLPLSPVAPKHNLPLELTSFVGRERELAEVRGLLASTRLLTLTGSGGCGKTRLAQQVASAVLANYSDGVWLVELAPLPDPSLVPQTIANSLGIAERPNQPILSVLMAFSASRHCLLVLDNCDHLIDACARMATSILQSCPRLTIMATSRQALRVPGEVQWHVPSLPIPDPTNLASSSGDRLLVLSEYPAIKLFVERAESVQSRFVLTPENVSAVARVCWQLDGLPLAIELAAARVPALSVESIADRLDQRFQLLTTGSRVALPRQQTLRATVDWSYNLLAETERVLLRNLAVFVGGFTLEAVEEICTGEGLAREDVLPLIAQLVDKSLVWLQEQGSADRYRQLESIRQYGGDRLAGSAERDAVRRRHASYYLELAERTKLRLRGPDQAEGCVQLEREQGNLRAALAWLRECGDVEQGLRLAGALGTFWLIRGPIGEAREQLNAVLAMPDTGATTPRQWRAKTLNRLSGVARFEGDFPVARAALEASLAPPDAGRDRVLRR